MSTFESRVMADIPTTKVNGQAAESSAGHRLAEAVLAVAVALIAAAETVADAVRDAGRTIAEGLRDAAGGRS